MDITRLTSRYGLPLTFLAILLLLLLLLFFFTLLSGRASVDLHPQTLTHDQNAEVERWCPVPPELGTVNDGMKPSFLLNDKSVLEKQVKRLREAINLPTISYPDWGDVEKDKRFESSHRFHNLLDTLSPIVHEDLELTVVNHLGLLCKLEGRDKSPKPILFSAHQDVLPAEPQMEWTHPLFNAHYDGDFVWGRGATSKNNLIALLSVLERLLEQNFMPKHTILVTFDFGEEIGGNRSAGLIAREAEKMYGKDGVAMVVDEGGMGVETRGESANALPAVAENGFMDVKFGLEVKGGHSSSPPSYSVIGVMSEMIVALESNPFQPLLAAENPFRAYLQFQVRHSPREVEGWLRESLLKGKSQSEIDIGRGLSSSRGKDAKLSMQTSQPVNIINAGNTTMQLPEKVSAILNYRIASQDTLESVKARSAETIAPIAKKYDMAVKGFGKDGKTMVGAQVLTLTSSDDLAPSPITSTGFDSKIWNIFAGTIRSVLEDTSTLKGKTFVPVGTIMIGKGFLLPVHNPHTPSADQE